MITFHAVVWLDHQEAHVLMFDRDHVQAQRIKSRSHHKHQGKSTDAAEMFAAVATALHGVHEILLTGPGLARDQLRAWCEQHQPAIARLITDSVPSDHPSDAQLLALAKKYFYKLDAMAAVPTAL
jgi:stalled ribosome rescue protein Dom34